MFDGVNSWMNKVPPDGGAELQVVPEMMRPINDVCLIPSHSASQ